MHNHATHHADARLTESPPCDGCRFNARCGIEGLACVAFSMYLANEPEVHWRLARRDPTTARYDALGLSACALGRASLVTPGLNAANKAPQ